MADSEVKNPRAGALFSRKFVATLYSVTLMFAITFLSTKYPALKEALDSFGGVAMGLLSIYCGGNVLNSYIAMKGKSNAASK